MLHFLCKIGQPHLQATSSLTQRQEPKRPEHARVQGGPMQLKCYGGAGGGYWKSGAKGRNHSALCALRWSVSYLTAKEQQFKCRRTGTKAVGRCDDGACVCKSVISERKGSKILWQLGQTGGGGRKDICVLQYFLGPIFQNLELKKAIWFLVYPKNLYLREGGKQNIVTSIAWTRP